MAILFVCAGNAARSQMAEAFYNELTGSDDAISAGTEAITEKPMPDAVIAVMNEVGVDVTDKMRKQVSKEMVDTAGRVVLMTYNSLPDYLRNDKKIEHWDIADPRGLGFDAHRMARDEIKIKVEKLLSE